MQSENLNFLEPSGPLQACNETALPFFTVNVCYKYLMKQRTYETSHEQAINSRAECSPSKCCRSMTAKHFLFLFLFTQCRWERIMLTSRSSIRSFVFDKSASSERFVGFSSNLERRVLTKGCRGRSICVKIGSVTVLLYCTAPVSLYPTDL
jgi:hypothetical protein